MSPRKEPRRWLKGISVVEKLWRQRVVMPNGCWESVLASGGRGYVRFATGDGRRPTIHRVAYETLVGPIPEGLEVMHRCDNRRCWRPSHLDLGTHGDNMRDMVAKGRQGKPGLPRDESTTCIHGHVGERRRTRNGDAYCRACVNLRTNALYHRRRSAA